MAQLVIAAAGAAIGGAIGGPMGAKIGWMIGSAIGGQLDKPDPTHGPRIEDKKVVTTTYGESIPIVWGTDRCKAQFLWASDLIEHKEEVGGKGFGGPDGFLYTYSVNVLISVCESPYAKPRYPLRLWGNGRLIGTFNGQSWEVDKNLIQAANVREYIGAADQMPDPVYEAAVGTENAVAYRGQLSIMLEGLQLADFGNRPPNFEVEVTDNIEVEPCPLDSMTFTDPQQPYLYSGSSAGISHSTFAAAHDPGTNRYFVLTTDTQGFSGTKQIEVYALVPNRAPELRHVVPLPSISREDSQLGGIVFDPENRLLWVVVGYSGGSTIFLDAGPVAAIVHADTYAVEYSGGRLTNYVESGYPGCPGISRDWGKYWTGFASGDDGRHAGTGASYGAMLRVHPDSGSPRGEVSWGTSSSAIIMYRMARLRNGQPWSYDHAPPDACRTSVQLPQKRGYHDHPAEGATNYLGDIVYVPKPDIGLPPEQQWIGGINYQVRWDEATVRMIDDEASTDVTGGGSGSAAWTGAMFAESRKKVFIVRDKQVGIIDLDLSTGDALQFSSPFADLTCMAEFGTPSFAVWSDYHDGILCGSTAGFLLRMWVVDPETDSIIAGPCDYNQFGIAEWNLYSQLVAVREIGLGWFAGLTATGNKIVTFKAPGGMAMGGGILLGEIVSDVWEMVGLDLADTDVSELTDIVPGYTLARQAAGRGVLEPLRAAYFFDGVGSGPIFKWVKRGKASVATIESGELGAHVFQLTQSEPEPAYELEHPDEIEAPRELTVKYIDALANYDPGTQKAQRQVGASLAPAVLDLPIVLGTDYAAQVAWTHLLLLHAANKPIRFKLSHAYEALEPADAITVPLSNGESRRVVIRSRTSARPLVEFDGFVEDGAVWDAIFPGVDRGQLPRQTAPAVLEDSVLELLDIPPLREADNRIVVYGSMSRALGDGWPGGTAYKEEDGVHNALYSTSSEATMGVLVTELAAWTKGNRWDRENTVQVQLRRGTLSSATELAVLNGANPIVIGDEVLQFANATLVGDGVWQLDTLLRHRLGTEWAALSAHEVGTRFVLLSASALRAIEYPLTDIGVARTYRAVTAGQAISDGSTTMLTAAGNSIKPLAPVHVQGTRDGADNLTVTWIRRARLNAEWQDGFDVPLDEVSESYRVNVYTDSTRSTVARSEDVAAASWSYSAADQTTDFGSAQATVYLTVYQITPTYNALGHAAEADL